MTSTATSATPSSENLAPFLRTPRAVASALGLPGLTIPGITPACPTVLRAHPNPEEGSATAEYAIATMAAVGFAGLLVVIMRSDLVRGILTDLIRNALTFVAA